MAWKHATHCALSYFPGRKRGSSQKTMVKPNLCAGRWDPHLENPQNLQTRRDKVRTKQLPDYFRWPICHWEKQSSGSQEAAQWRQPIPEAPGSWYLSHCWLSGMQGSAGTNSSPSSCLDGPAHWLGSLGFPARTIFSSWNIKSASGIAYEIRE